MDIFVIHSGKGREKIENELEIVRKQLPSPDALNAILLQDSDIFWKMKARSCIKRANFILYVANSEPESRNVIFELKLAIKHRKEILVIPPDENWKASEGLKTNDCFTGKEIEYGHKIISYSQIPSVIESYQESTFGLFNDGCDEKTGDGLNAYLEQYKLFLQTSEDLVNRRQNVNNFYVSIHSAILAFMGAMFALEIDLHYFLFFGIVLCLVGAVLSYSWRNMLISFGQLNSAKMKILAMLEKHLPLSMYDAEWNVLDDPLRKEHYKSFTQSEGIIPLCFFGLYMVLFAFLLLGIILQMCN